MMTNSGVLVTPRSDGVPTLADIALSLSRLPRFAGHTTELYTVGEHVMAAATYARDPDVWGCELELHALLHDAHEAITADVPTTWKNDKMAIDQQNLDRRLYAAYGLPTPTPAQRLNVRAIDRALLLAEAKLFHPRAYARLREEMQSDANHTALIAVGWVRGSFDGEPARVRAGLFAYLNRLISKWGVHDRH